ncbi:hypothetical protein DN752_09895 [Echinicola strongylocentroti]|uniref:Uncharacterized protein n=1 Tax=Echinicola strongylocentroti TaxID=1795355 RepID=A0A2Z4IRD1_9BACT|nr:hypothetical protein DN752_09895 [Echinicola strongylocentroti]
MLIALVLLLKTFFYASLVSIAVGFIRPVFVLWFMDKCNRMRVLSFYGILALVFYVLYELVNHLLL